MIDAYYMSLSRTAPGSFYQLSININLADFLLIQLFLGTLYLRYYPNIQISFSILKELLTVPFCFRNSSKPNICAI